MTSLAHTHRGRAGRRRPVWQQAGSMAAFLLSAGLAVLAVLALGALSPRSR